MERSRGKERFHWETLEVLEQRVEHYRDRAGELNVEIIDANQPIDAIAELIRERLEKLVQLKKGPSGFRVEGRPTA